MRERSGASGDADGGASWKNSEDLERFVSDLRASKQDAEIQLQLSQEFLSTLAHELREPLNTIVGWASLLVQDQLRGVEFRQACEAIHRNAKLQSQLVDKLFDAGRLAAGRLRLNYASVDLADLTESVIDAVRPIARAKGVRIDSSIDRFAGPVLGDRARCEQVLFKILSDAVRRAPPLGRVTIRLTQGKGTAEIRVNDTGSSPSRDEIARMLNGLIVTPGDSSSESGRLGLGMGMIRGIVELHAGSLAIDPGEDGSGVKVTVSLPLHKDGGTPVTAASSQGPMARVDLKGTRVLVVDDDVDARELVATIITHSGGLVHKTGSCQEALEVLRSFRPEVLVSDLAMPGEDGLTLLKMIRDGEAEHGVKGLPAIALTGFAGAEDRRSAMLAGYQVHLPKPADPLELLMAITNLAGRGRRESTSKPGE
jgi:CheY-like chemotaxis protein